MLLAARCSVPRTASLPRRSSSTHATTPPPPPPPFAASRVSPPVPVSVLDDGHALYTSASSPAGAKRLHVPQPFRAELNGKLPELEIAFEEYGDPANPVVFIMPSLSASSHVKSSATNPEPGWWEDIVGAGAAYGIDLAKYRVICASNLGGPFGTTNPTSPSKVHGGEQYGPRFPQVTPRDVARVHKLLLDRLGLARVHAVIGASVGGMVALEFAALFPQVTERLVAISCTGRSTPGTVALRSVMRQAVIHDPNFHEGYYFRHNTMPLQGMATARELGMIGYRSLEEFNSRFQWDLLPSRYAVPRGSAAAAAETAAREAEFRVTHNNYALGDHAATNLSWDVERYLDKKSRHFGHHYDANAFLVMSKCADLMDLGRGSASYAEGLLRVTSPSLIIGSELDILLPLDEQQRVAHLLQAHGRSCAFRVARSLAGHDSFLTEHHWYAPRLSAFLADQPVPP